MGQKQCAKCGELVDEAKAFCPGCGNAFVEEEKRKSESNFEAMDNTVQLGNTMYNQMLSDMGLNISKNPEATKPPVAPKPEAKRIEIIQPVAAATPAPPRVDPKPLAKPSSNIKWFILGGLLVLLVFALVVVVAALLIYFWPLLK
ncbi:hypothetical protein BH10ACI2_BH10ACI2_03060 [soil metagenome]